MGKKIVYYGLLFDELMKKCAKCGVKRSDIGKRTFGELAYSRIYTIKNPTLEMMDRIYNSFLDIVKEQKTCLKSKTCKKNKKN